VFSTTSSLKKWGGYWFLINLPQPTSIGEKRNIGASSEYSDFIVTMDDDDFSLPNRLSSQIMAFQSFPNAIYCRSRRQFLARDEIVNIYGQRWGCCYDTAIVKTAVALSVRWENVNWCEDHKFYEALKRNGYEEGKHLIQTSEIFQVKRRHSHNVSIAHQPPGHKNEADFSNEFEESEAKKVILNLLDLYLGDFICSICQ